MTNTFEWLNDVREKIGFETWWIFPFKLLTGMRTGEVINSLNLIADNCLENYLDKERMVVRALLVLT